MAPCLCSNLRRVQDALVHWAPYLLASSKELRADGLALPAELLPYAAAQLLPLLLLPPEQRLCALDLHHNDRRAGTVPESFFLMRVLVRTRLLALEAWPRCTP